VSSSGTGRTLAAIVGLGICNHAVLNGSRVLVSLDALHLGATPAVVGALMALFALLPMLFAVQAGRLSDRVGVRVPMLYGSACVGLGAMLPFALPGLTALFVAAPLIGAGFMLFQIATQHVTGDLGPPSERVANYGLLALGYSISGFLGPLIAGFAIDRFGFAATFGLFALIPLLPVAVLATGRIALPRAHRGEHAAHKGRMFDLLRLPVIRRLLLVNALFALGWDLHTIFVPIYGARIGLAAAEIGMILSAFAAATFVVRFGMRWISRMASERQVLTAALLVAGLVYFVFPFSTSATMLMALSFALGLGLGSGQPMVMSLLHAQAPSGRMGEASGVRMALIQAMAVAVPLVFGALGSSLGLLPVFWTVGLLLGGGGLWSKPRR
jgi:MFS family permease